MTKTPFYKGHRWTTEELTALMRLWADGKSPDEIATALNSTGFAIMKMVIKLRKNGIPLQRRRKGHVAGRANQLWTQSELEYLLRRRQEKATLEEIGSELGRTWSAVSAMVQKLNSEAVPVPMYGRGVRRLWDSNTLKATLLHIQKDPTQLQQPNPAAA